MVSRNPQELQSSNSEKKPFGLRQLYENTKRALYPERINAGSSYKNEQRMSAKEAHLRSLHQNAQLLGIFISLDSHPEVGNLIRDELKKLLKNYKDDKNIDDSTLIQLRSIRLLSLLNESEQLMVQEWLATRSIHMDTLYSRTLGEIADFLAEKSLDGSLKVSNLSSALNIKDRYSSREKTTTLVFKAFTMETIDELVSPHTFRELYSRVAAAAHSLP